MKYLVTYSVEFQTTIEAESEEELADLCAEIDIPEGPEGKYVDGSFSIDSATPIS